MAHRIVGEFKIIDIDHQKRALLIRVGGQILFNQMLDGRFVIKVCQRIPLRFFTQ